MPDPSLTREWAVQSGGGPDELNRELVDIIPQDQMPTREYAPSPEGGPDELARGGADFEKAVMASRAAPAEPAPTKPAKKASVKVEDPLETAAASRE